MAGAVVHDIVVIGGGIDGRGSACDAARRSYSLFLAEINELAGGTSPAKTKLTRGALRYLFCDNGRGACAPQRSDTPRLAAVNHA